MQGLRGVNKNERKPYQPAKSKFSTAEVDESRGEEVNPVDCLRPCDKMEPLSDKVPTNLRQF